MNDPMTNRAAELLRRDQDSFVPLDRLYTALTSEGLMAWVDPVIFRRLLESDPRFEVLDGLSENLFPDAALTASGLDVLDFLNGPWVILQERKLSPLDVMTDILHHLQRMNETLEIAWSSLADAPETGETKADLLNMLLLGDLLERQIRDALFQILQEHLEDTFALNGFEDLNGNAS